MKIKKLFCENAFKFDLHILFICFDQFFELIIKSHPSPYSLETLLCIFLHSPNSCPLFCYCCLHIWIYINIYIPKYNPFSQCSITCMSVFRADHFVTEQIIGAVSPGTSTLPLAAFFSCLYSLCSIDACFVFEPKALAVLAPHSTIELRLQPPC